MPLTHQPYIWHPLFEDHDLNFKTEFILNLLTEGFLLWCKWPRIASRATVSSNQKSILITLVCHLKIHVLSVDDCVISLPAQLSLWRHQRPLNDEDYRFRARTRHSDFQRRFSMNPIQDRSQRSRSILHHPWSCHIALGLGRHHQDWWCIRHWNSNRFEGSWCNFLALKQLDVQTSKR